MIAPCLWSNMDGCFGNGTLELVQNICSWSAQPLADHSYRGGLSEIIKLPKGPEGKSCAGSESPWALGQPAHAGRAGGDSWGFCDPYDFKT